MKEKFEANISPEEREKVFEKFKQILTKSPEYNVQDGSMGESRHEDIIELLWSNKEGVKLNQTGESNSNYAGSKKETYKAEPSVVQIAEVIGEKGNPEKVNYTRIDLDDWIGQEDSKINERQNAEFKFSEVESEILKVARVLNPKYEKMSLEEIGNDLRAEEEQKRHNELIEKFKDILSKKPEYNFNDGQMGESIKEDNISVIFENEKGLEEAIQLNKEGEWSSNYANEETVKYEADLTIQQLAKIIAEQGKPKSIIYGQTNIINWPGQEYINERTSGIIDYSEIESEILKAARALDPKFGKMSLEEIGKVIKS